MVSKQAVFGKGIGIQAVPDDEMIEDTNVKQSQSLFQSLRDEFVRLARFGNPRRVVVGKNHRSRIMVQSNFHHFAGINAGSINGAAKQFDKLNDPVLIVQQQTGKLFVGLGTQGGNQLAAGQFWAGECIAAV